MGNSGPLGEGSHSFHPPTSSAVRMSDVRVQAEAKVYQLDIRLTSSSRQFQIVVFESERRELVQALREAANRLEKTR